MRLDAEERGPSKGFWSSGEVVAVELPIHFPAEADLIYQEAQAYRRLSPTERFLTIIDLIASGTTLLNQSPQREAGRRLQEAQEAAWQRAHKELFARHGR
jgi:hypothetical protein